MTESVMMMIPLLITFLSVLQISTGVMSRTVSTNVVQGSVAGTAINGSDVVHVDNQSGGNSKPSNATNQVIELPGGGSFTTGTQQIHMPSITPLLPGGDNYEATGLAITE